MLANLPVARSAGARTVFLVSAIVTVMILFWDRRLMLSGGGHGLAPIFFVLFTYFDYPAAMCSLLILVAAVFVPARLPLRALLRWVGEHPAPIAAGAAVLLCAGALVVYQNHPLAMDEYAALFQSQAFAAGHLTGQFPVPLLDWLIPKGFQQSFLSVSLVTGQVASGYWPSFALLLTPFTWLGVPWACNPVISALTLIAVHRLALKIFDDREAAGLAVLLTAASPVFFANGISYYSMSAHLLANTVFALLLVEPTSRKALVAGIVGSIALTLHNPVPHILFALPWLFWTAKRENGFRFLSWLGVGYLPLCLLLGVGWFWFSGHLMHDGMSAAASAGSTDTLSRVSVGFGFPSHTVVLARLIGLAKVWLWAVPGLVVLAAVGAWKWRHDARCQLLLASAVLTLVGYLFVVVDQGHGWGFRYFHSAWVALPLLAAGALTRSPATERGARLLEDDDARAFVIACALLTLVGGVGFRAMQIHEFIADDLSQLPAYAGSERRVVFIDASNSFYGADLVQNDPLLRGNVIHMLSHGAPDDSAVMRRQFPELHQVYADLNGTVWSLAPPQVAGEPHRSRPR